MATNKDICDRLDFLTDKMSTQFRTLSIGLLAFCGGVLLSKDKLSQPVPEWVQIRLIGVALGVVVTIAVDLLQLVSGYADARRVYKDLNKKREDAAKRQCPAAAIAALEVEYDESKPLFRLQLILFWAKFALLGALVIWLSIFMVKFLAR
jgi:hypothetical protein